MMVASLRNVAQSHGSQPVLTDVNMTLNAGRKIGLIGANGSGKTTLIRVLLGELPADSGQVLVPPDTRVGYVPQAVAFDEGQTVMGYMRADMDHLTRALRGAEERLAQADEGAMEGALRSYERARLAYDAAEGDLFEDRVVAMLDALGLGGRTAQTISTLSGGERNVLAMAEALLARPDLLILDEPGNHLDMEGVAWLEAFLARYDGAALIVSHNRYLLDRVVDGIYHLEDGEVRYYDGGYSAYRSTVLRERMAQQADYSANQKRLAQLEDLVKRFAAIASRTSDPAWGKRLRARRSQLSREQADAVEAPQGDAGKIRARFEAEASRADVALQIRGYSKGFEGRPLFDDADLDVACGERVALVGANGSGKSTLIRDIIAEGDWEHPVLRVGPSLQVGYSAQQQEVLDPDKTVMDQLRTWLPMTQQAAFGFLSRFHFGARDVQKRVGDLSGGERNRLQLARLVALEPNFLILDEPTNHLDIPAREAVEDALADFKGTILVVSHDRYFLDKLAERVVEIEDRKMVSFDGNFSEYWHARKAASARSTGRVNQRGKDRSKPRQEAGAGNQGRDERRAAELEARIQEAEARKVELEAQLSRAFERGDQHEGRRLDKQLRQLGPRVAELYEQWMALD